MPVFNTFPVLKIQGTQVNYVKIAFTDFGYKKNHLEKVVLCPEQESNLHILANTRF